jgi:DNA-binding CsgD family transcriptional regulator
LAEREVRICVLVMIGLSYAEIAEILYRAESGIGKDKYTIAKRLGVRVKDLQNTLRAIAGDKEHA